jgi:hypothetical protein
VALVRDYRRAVGYLDLSHRPAVEAPHGGTGPRPEAPRGPLQHRSISARCRQARVPAGAGGLAAEALEVELLAYLRTTDYEDYLAVREELRLAIMGGVAAAGTAFALPERTDSPARRREGADRGA